MKKATTNAKTGLAYREKPTRIKIKQFNITGNIDENLCEYEIKSVKRPKGFNTS